jgi:hypothetical protein
MLGSELSNKAEALTRKKKKNQPILWTSGLVLLTYHDACFCIFFLRK